MGKKRMKRTKRTKGGVLKLGLPAGSLRDATLSLLKKAGYSFSVASRSYVPVSTDPEISARMFRAQEIPRYVADGSFDAGITGQDMVAECGARVREVEQFVYARQGFVPVRWVLAVPNGSSIRSLCDLNGKRVATEAVNLAKRFFRSKGIRARVEFSWGATEAKAPDLVDAVIETTETGSSLTANNLRIVAEIMRSSTVLVANPRSFGERWKRGKILEIAMLMRGAMQAESMVGLKMNVPRNRLNRVLGLLPAMKRPTISPLSDPKWVSLETVIEESAVRKLITALKLAGAQGLVEYPLNKVIP
jgi:ATP phosphoribosyltransferase